MRPAPAPRWFWLLPLLAIAAWWPWAPWWQSDDYFAVHYAQEGTNVLRDFVGPQYGAVDKFLFHRPFVTASFWLEQCLGGPSPFLSHLSNVLAHAASALLLALVWRRFASAGAAFAAGLVWALQPSHSGAIEWAVGRVDSHSTPWLLLGVLFLLRQHEARLLGERPTVWPPILAMVGALLTKENAFVQPLLATLVVAFAATGPWRTRGTLALRAAWPLWLLLALWLPLRWLLLGRFGGYDGASLAPWPMLQGLGTSLCNLAAPWRWVGVPAELPAGVVAASGFVPTCIAIGLAVWRRPRLVAGAVVVAAVALLPTASMLTGADNPLTLRYWYLPLAALCGIAAAGGRVAVLALLVACVPPLLQMRTVQQMAAAESRACHDAVVACARTGAKAPMFVAGLPVATKNGNAIQLHLGVDRITAPPHLDRTVPLFALRPLLGSPAAFRLADPGHEFALPSGSSWRQESGMLRTLPPPAGLPPLVVTGAVDADFVVDLTATALARLLDPAASLVLHTPDVRPMAYRLTVFTAGGYVTTLFLDHGDGSID
ncbi:MAG: hypothetical protein JNK15_21610, partial [Planctomycetes bacterium]|nr:hypothetical protein [Planctomycetota bacterium]